MANVLHDYYMSNIIIKECIIINISNIVHIILLINSESYCIPSIYKIKKYDNIIIIKNIILHNADNTINIFFVNNKPIK
jgi:hypothetical protein